MICRRSLLPVLQMFFPVFIYGFFSPVEVNDLVNNVFFLFFRGVFWAALGLCLCAQALLWLRRAGATLRCGARASRCSGFSCGARALGARSSVVAVHGLSSCGSWALEYRFSSCSARA